MNNANFKLKSSKQLKLPDHFIGKKRHNPLKTVRSAILRASKGIVIHEKISNDTVIISLIEKETGDLHSKYHHFFHDIYIVNTYINGGINSSIIISNLRVNTNKTQRELGVQEILGQYSLASS